MHNQRPTGESLNPHATRMFSEPQDGQGQQPQPQPQTGAGYYGRLPVGANVPGGVPYNATPASAPYTAAPGGMHHYSNNNNSSMPAANAGVGVYGGGYGYNAHAAMYTPGQGAYAMSPPPHMMMSQQQQQQQQQMYTQYYDATQMMPASYQTAYAPQAYGGVAGGNAWTRGGATAGGMSPAAVAYTPSNNTAAATAAMAPAVTGTTTTAPTAASSSDAAKLSLGGRASAAAPPVPRKKGGAVFSLGKKKQESATTEAVVATPPPCEAMARDGDGDGGATAAGKARNESEKAEEATAAATTNAASPPSSPVGEGGGDKKSSATAAANKATSSGSAEAAREVVRKELARQREQSKKQFVRDPRPHFNVVFCGHVDAGKSTISGHLLMEKGLVDQREMDKLRREAELHHREGWEYAYVMDVSEEERSKGITRETGAAYFETAQRRVTVLDAPGHKAFVPSMIGGATQADVCVLVISSRTGEFETGFEKGGQTREHAMLVRTCGVKQMICVVNKMDEMQWSKERYDTIVAKLKPFLRQNGYDEERKNLVFIPVAGLTGDNLIKHTSPQVCAWYDGPTMMDVIDTLVLPETRSADDALCIPLVGAYKDDGKNFIYGKIESGSIAVGEKLQLLPTRQEGVVEGIAIESTEFEKCYPGDNVHLRVRGIDEADVHAGYVATSMPTTLRAVEFFQARVVVLEVKNIISAGSRFMLHIHSAQEEASFGKLLAKLDKKTGAVIEKEPACARAGDVVVVRIELNSPLVVETHKEFDKMGRFMLRDEGKTIAIGLVTKLYLSTHDNIITKPAATAS